jgi:pSer/pThr/pTyr-binding forkhead associated (FHA) protein
VAILVNMETGGRVILRSQHVFGRHPGSSNTQLSNPDASRMHATVLFSGAHWLLQDSSTNGTYINGEHFIHGIKHRLKTADKINFGNLSAASWKLLDDSAPKSMLLPISKNLNIIELEDIVVLPSEESPQLMLYQSPQGSWLCEDHGGVTTLTAGHKVSTRQGTWYFVDADTLLETIQVDGNHHESLPPIDVNFEVSQNEEHVSLQLTLDNQLFDLGRRTHHYLLLLLARQRIADTANGVSDSEKGWIDREILSKSLGLDENHINIQIYRLRKQMTTMMPSFPVVMQIVQRRRGELRFACDSVTINGGYHNDQQVPSAG